MTDKEKLSLGLFGKMNDDILPLCAPLDIRTEIITDAPKFAQTSIFKRRGLYVQLGQNIHERAREALIELDKGR